VLRVESYLWIALSLENTLSHVIIAPADARVAAPGVDDDGTASFASGGVRDDGSSFKFESSVRRMERTWQAELDERFRWIEFQRS
jgi:hypothetical protein